MGKKIITVSDLINDFSKVIKVTFNPSQEYKDAIESLLLKLNDVIVDEKTRENYCIQVINHKFDFNKKNIKNFIDTVALKKFFFNYHQKKIIKKFFDASDVEGFTNWIKVHFGNKAVLKELVNLFHPIDKKTTISRLHEELDEKHKKEILHSLFSAYIFNSFSAKDIYPIFSDKGSDYVENYFEYLHKCLGEELQRKKALDFLVIDDSLVSLFATTKDLKNSLFHYIKSSYSTLSNHCYLSIYISLGEKYKALKWELYSDMVLFAEKFNEENLKIGYFHPNKIAENTKRYIKKLDLKDAKFNIANSGFSYKDCFILTDNDLKVFKTEEYNDNYDLLLLFEKNERDETVIPCPSCRSINVRGNSYPSIGVKSWECNNILCPDKSKFNRGKRYSFASLIKQEAIFYEANEIKNGTIKQWQLDVLQRPKKIEILEFLIKHYTLLNDTIEVQNLEINDKNLFQRKVNLAPFKVADDDYLSSFYNSAYFKRFLLRDLSGKAQNRNLSPFNNIEIYNGDSTVVLENMKDENIDAAVTSPPYYNAKEYSQWDNIYCYLFDMYNNACAVYDSLKPGATYLYNIFDYFDNENNIVFSAMGKKRMILGAYIIFLFQKAGFQLTGNTIWYKGHIQGNRSFNQGNTFPYYQAPLNCYEHIFQFIKPGDSIERTMNLPDIVYFKPVHKMIKGKNTLGHTAPFPKSLPNILLKRMSKSEIILDPYAGSFTTARAAISFEIKSINIELDASYCDLGIKLINENKDVTSDLISI